MNNVISFSKKKKQKQELEQPSTNIFDMMDAKFRGDNLSNKDLSEVRKYLRDRLSSLGYTCFLTSKKVDSKWLKQYKPILLTDQKVGFSFEVSKLTKLKEGWIFYPLQAKQTKDHSELLGEIIQFIEDKKNGK
ncbi:hypothetical protein ACWNG8_21625 [Aeromonas veronii]